MGEGASIVHPLLPSYDNLLLSYFIIYSKKGKLTKMRSIIQIFRQVKTLYLNY